MTSQYLGGANTQGYLHVLDLKLLGTHLKSEEKAELVQNLAISKKSILFVQYL